MKLKIEIYVGNPGRTLRVFTIVAEVIKEWLANNDAPKQFDVPIFVTAYDDSAWKYLNSKAPAACVLIVEDGQSVREDIDEFQKVVQTPESDLRAAILESIRLYEAT